MWSVLLATARGDKTIDQFDCSISNLSEYIGKNGTMSATVKIPNQGIGTRAQAILGRAGQLTAYVYHGNDLWWGGLVNGTPAKGGRTGASLQISAATFGSYLDRREVRTDRAYAQREQVEILRDAWLDVQRTEDGNLGITVPAIPATGIRRDLSVLRSAARTWSAVVKEAAGGENGFEWMIDVYDDGTGNRVRELKTGYPQIGRPSYEQKFTYPGNITDYSWNADWLAGATSFQGRGDSVGPMSGNTQQPIMTDLGAFDAVDLLRGGALRTDATIDRPGVTQVSTLNAWTGKDLQRAAGAIPFVDISVQLDGFNRSILGTMFGVEIDDFLFPRGPEGQPGFASRHRCIGYEIKPDERGTVGDVKLIIEEV